MPTRMRFAIVLAVLGASGSFSADMLVRQDGQLLASGKLDGFDATKLAGAKGTLGEGVCGRFSGALTAGERSSPTADTRPVPEAHLSPHNTAAPFLKPLAHWPRRQCHAALGRDCQSPSR